ncbi:glycosyltransferase family 4 protein [Confluentibacter citreus]|uniref:glycosyltransferase family 4 protein n=1 Tax=Confluentibacter citreus TaxID=2007307 RepID=UPI000C282B28|nr:glycosyltransferase family 4 protein [Confluentibacter citreus]
MKNILYIGNNLSETGKTETTIETLSENLRMEGYTVYAFSNNKNKLLRLFNMLFAILKYAKKVDYVLIDTYSTQNFYYAYLCSQLCRILKLKYIPILHGGNLPNRLKSKPKLSTAIFSNAYKNVSPSLYIKSEFEKLGYSNVICIPNAIDIKNYPFKQRHHEVVNLLWVRSFSKIYNPLLAIKLLKALKDEGYKATLCMVGPEGDGSFKEAQNLAKTLQVEVKFTGKLSKEEWIHLSEDYNIFINTTNFDNMPVSVMEAMALGLPIVSTNVGGMSFLIENGHDGVLVNPDDSDEFAKAIKWVVSHPNETEQMALHARKKAEQFDWETVKREWQSLLR